MDIPFTKLKKYASCANCRLYELPMGFKEGYCMAGFPLDKLEAPKEVGHRHGVDTFFISHKPKFGCVQKNYHGSRKIDFTELVKAAKLLS